MNIREKSKDSICIPLSLAAYYIILTTGITILLFLVEASFPNFFTFYINKYILLIPIGSALCVYLISFKEISFEQISLHMFLKVFIFIIVQTALILLFFLFYKEKYLLIPFFLVCFSIFIAFAFLQFQIFFNYKK